MTLACPKLYDYGYIAVPLNMRYTLDRQGKGFSLLFVPHQIGNRYKTNLSHFRLAPI